MFIYHQSFWKCFIYTFELFSKKILSDYFLFYFWFSRVSSVLTNLLKQETCTVSILFFEKAKMLGQFLYMAWIYTYKKAAKKSCKIIFSDHGLNFYCWCQNILRIRFLLIFSVWIFRSTFHIIFSQDYNIKKNTIFIHVNSLKHKHKRVFIFAIVVSY